MEATFAMLNVPKTVRLLFTIRVVVEWQVLLDMKRTLWNQYANGWRPLFPKIRATDPTTAIAAAGTSCRHQILTEPIESTTSSFYILFKKITRLNLGFEEKNLF
jgi:hypothetical protein